MHSQSYRTRHINLIHVGPSSHRHLRQETWACISNSKYEGTNIRRKSSSGITRQGRISQKKSHAGEDIRKGWLETAIGRDTRKKWRWDVGHSKRGDLHFFVNTGLFKRVQLFQTIQLQSKQFTVGGDMHLRAVILIPQKARRNHRSSSYFPPQGVAVSKTVSFLSFTLFTFIQQHGGRGGC